MCEETNKCHVMGVDQSDDEPIYTGEQAKEQLRTPFVVCVWAGMVVKKPNGLNIC